MLYTINDADYIESIWDFVQLRPECTMYKTRLTRSHIAWVVDLPNERLDVRFLLEYSNVVSRINGTYTHGAYNGKKIA